MNRALGKITLFPKDLELNLSDNTKCAKVREMSSFLTGGKVG